MGEAPQQVAENERFPLNKYPEPENDVNAHSYLTPVAESQGRLFHPSSMEYLT